MRWDLAFTPDLYRLRGVRLTDDSGQTTEAFVEGSDKGPVDLEYAATAVAITVLAYLALRSWDAALAVGALAFAAVLAAALLRAARRPSLVVPGLGGKRSFEIVRDAWREHDYPIRELKGPTLGVIRTSAAEWELLDPAGHKVASGTWNAPKLFHGAWTSFPGATKFAFEDAPLRFSADAGSAALVELTSGAGALEIDDALLAADARLWVGAALVGLLRTQELATH